MNCLNVAYDCDQKWCVDAMQPSGEWEAATDDVAECYWLSYKKAIRLARDLMAKRGAHVTVYLRNGTIMKLHPTERRIVFTKATD